MSTNPDPEAGTPQVLGCLGAASVLLELTSSLVLIVVGIHEVYVQLVADNPSTFLEGYRWFYAGLLGMVASSLLNLILARWRARISRGELERASIWLELAKKQHDRSQGPLEAASVSAEVSQDDDGGGDTAS